MLSAKYISATYLRLFRIKMLTPAKKRFSSSIDIPQIIKEPIITFKKRGKMLVRLSALLATCLMKITS